MQTLTFYSYKGGVGRTLMVANIARYLAGYGRKVVVVDFDLEAPGLHYKLGVTRPERGLVDLFHAALASGALPALAPYVTRVELPASTPAGGSLHLFPAGAAPSRDYWRQLAKLDWHGLFYAEGGPGVLLFLELRERIRESYQPDFLLIDSRTGITEVGGATTTLLADRVVCLLLNNRENLEGAREVLGSLRRAPRPPGAGPIEIWPVLSRIPEQGGEAEATLVREVREYLAEAAESPASSTAPELFVLHTDPGLALRETLCIGVGGAEDSILLRDYLAIFKKLVPLDDLVGPTILDIAERLESGREGVQEGAQKDFDKLVEVAGDRSGLEVLLDVERQRLAEEREQAAESAAKTRARTLLGALKLPAELVPTAAAYLTWLGDTFRHLSFKGFGITDRVPLQLPLLEMYVPLRARQEAPEGETFAKDLRLAGRRLTAEEQEEVGERLSGPRPVLELLGTNDGLVLLGDPGSGKTTFLKFLALAFAEDRDEVRALGQHLPVYLPLAACARAFAAGEAGTIEEVLQKTWEHVHPRAGELVIRALAAGGAVLLLDGLDEVHAAGGKGELAAQVKDLFERLRGTGNKLVLTSRIVGYREVRLVAKGLAEGTLVDFGKGEIDDFAAKWTRALEQAAAGGSALAVLEAARERDELLAAVHGNPRVEELAANPLLLTILALMKRQGVQLPERRVELYEQYVKTLLHSWNVARTGQGLDVAAVLRVLAPLALWMQESSPEAGLVDEAALRAKLAELCASEFDAERLLNDVRHHAGLLIERGPGRYGFLHLTFQEYLAAVALGEKIQEGVGAVIAALRPLVGRPEWREVFLLTIGYLGRVLRLERAASAVLEGLLEERAAAPLSRAGVSAGGRGDGGEGPVAGDVEILAGWAVADIGEGGVTASCRQKVVEALLETMRDDQRVDPRRRAAAGSALAAVGDPRPEVMTVDGMEFCEVPAGPFRMGSEEDDKDAALVEKPAHNYTIPYAYRVARYPVTVAQFREFDASVRGEPNAPVVRVSWEEAVAFCDWLAARWRASGKIGKNERVTLPSEPEWEKAPRGTDGRRYSWGKEPDPNRMNFGETGILRTSAVGCFPGGVSTYGCEEMCGNVCEWTRSGHGPYPYPEKEEERFQREDMEVSAQERRVLRGGSCFDTSWWVRCACRLQDTPVAREDLIGFRVVLLPFSSGL